MSPYNMRITYIVAFAMLGAIFIFFFISVLRYQRKYIHLQKDLIKAEVDTLEKERQRIAGDLHDSLGPMLSAVKLQINSLDTELPDDITLIEKASGHIDNIMSNIRSIANSLTPKLLVRKGLEYGIQDLCLYTQSVFPIVIKYQATQVPRISGEAELNIYRIIQEIIHNTIKHAHCKELIIKLYSEKQKLVLLTADDGKGFEKDELKDAGSGLGLRNIETRTEILKGTYEIISKAGGGTKFIFEFPVSTPPGNIL